MCYWRSGSVTCLAFLLLVLTWLHDWTALPDKDPLPQFSIQQVTPSPTYDPLEIPVLPPNPSEFERGKYLYYFHCMPCHGERGQGLTDEFRQLWEEHNNCWGRGCHAGRLKDEGFPIPTVVPAVIGQVGVLVRFPNIESLLRYLHDTHPPQKPGILTDQEYNALSIYLWRSNNKTLPELNTETPTTQNALQDTGQPTKTTTVTTSAPEILPTRPNEPTDIIGTHSSVELNFDSWLRELAALVFLVVIILVFYVLIRISRK
jgi:hypothetical protein